MWQIRLVVSARAIFEVATNIAKIANVLHAHPFNFKNDILPSWPKNVFAARWYKRRCMEEWFYLHPAHQIPSMHLWYGQYDYKCGC
jgi:hypothetical protein